MSNEMQKAVDEFKNNMWLTGNTVFDIGSWNKDYYRINDKNNEMIYIDIFFEKSGIEVNFVDRNSDSVDISKEYALNDIQSVIKDTFNHISDNRLKTYDDFMSKCRLRNNTEDRQKLYDDIQAFNLENKKYKAQITAFDNELHLNINGDLFELGNYLDINKNIDKTIKDHFLESGSEIDRVNKCLDVQKKEYLFKNISSAISDELSKKTTEQDTRTVYKKNKI